MRYIFILLILLAGCAPLKYYPEGMMGTATPYYQDYTGEIKCYICGESAYLFKIDSKGRTICPEHYRELNNSTPPEIVQ